MYYLNARYNDTLTYRCELYQSSRCTGVIKKNMKTGLEEMKDEHNFLPDAHPCVKRKRFAKVAPDEHVDKLDFTNEHVKSIISQMVVQDP